MWALYTGKVYSFQAEDYDRNIVMRFFLNLGSINIDNKLCVYQDDKLAHILTYMDVLYKRKPIEKVFYHSKSVFLEANKWIKEYIEEDDNVIENGRCFAVLNEQNQLEYIIEYLDNNKMLFNAGCLKAKKFDIFPRYYEYDIYMEIILILTFYAGRIAIVFMNLTNIPIHYQSL